MPAPAKPIEFHEEAAAEYAAALGWYFERSPFVAERFVAEVSAAVLTIAQAPHRWPESGSGVRHLSLRQFPYAVFYREALFRFRLWQLLTVAEGRDTGSPAFDSNFVRGLGTRHVGTNGLSKLARAAH